MEFLSLVVPQNGLRALLKTATKLKPKQDSRVASLFQIILD